MKRYLSVILLLIVFNFSAEAQFQRSGNVTMGRMGGPPGANMQTGTQVNPESDVKADTTAGFSMKALIRGYMGRDTLKPGYMLLGTAIVPGAGQIYNKQWWKVPIIYGGLGAGIYTGISNNIKYRQTGDEKYKLYRNLGYIGAGLTYWGSLLDATISYKTEVRIPVAAKSTIYSALLPGLGQAYNGDYWKIPIWWTGFVACGYFFHQNDIQYKRFKYICKMDNDPNSGYIGQITASQSEWYRDTYRRFRDYSIVAFVLVYALNVIDANVFAHMADFDVSDNLATLQLEPAIIEPLTPYYSPTYAPVPSFGLQMTLNF